MLQTNVGPFLLPRVGFVPQSAPAGTITGAAVERTGFFSAVLVAATGADVGANTVRSLAVRIQESADGTTGWVDVPGAAVPAITAVNTQADIDVNLAGVARFVRVLGVVSFTGGTGLLVGATLVLGGSDRRPV